MPFAPLLSAATRTLGMARASAMQFLGPRNFTRDYYQARMATKPSFGSQGGVGAIEWLSGAAKDAAKGLGTLTSVGAAGVGATKALELFSTSLLKSRENLSLFHGGIAAAFARMERQDLTLQLRRAQATAPGVQRFADAVMQMREDTLQGRILMENLWNSVGTGMATIVSFVSQTASPVLKQISDFLVTIGAISPPNAARSRMQGDLVEFFQGMSRGEFGRPINQRPGRDGEL